MKKFLLLSAILGSIAIITPNTSAKNGTMVANSEQAVYVRTQPRRWRGRRSIIRTRIVYRYGQRYRETYRIIYWPNGRRTTQVISRVRLGARRVVVY